MIRNTNRFLPVLLCIFATLTMFTSCDRDTFEVLKEERVPPEIRGKRVRIQELMAQPNLARKLTALSTTGLAKSTNLAGIQIDTTNIRAIESDNYVSYTFKIVQDSIERQTVLKNYMLTIVNDTIDIQHLVEYDVLAPHVYDKDNIRLERVYGDELRSQFSKCGTSSTTWSYDPQCTYYSCIGTGSDNHEFGDSTCELYGEDGGAYSVCYDRWTSTTVYNPCNFIDLGPGSSGGGTPSGTPINTDPTDPDDGVIDIGVGPNDGLPPIEIDEELLWRDEILNLPAEPCGVNHDCVSSIKTMARGLERFHGTEGAAMAEYFNEVTFEMEHGSTLFTFAEKQSIYDAFKLITQNFNSQMQQAIIASFGEGVGTIVEIALFEVGGEVAIKLIQKIPVSWVYRGTRLNNAVQKVGLLGTRGTRTYIREVRVANPVSSATEIFNSLTKHKIGPITYDINTGVRTANMGNGNFITFRNITQSSSNVPATITLNFPNIWPTARDVKFLHL